MREDVHSSGVASIAAGDNVRLQVTNRVVDSVATVEPNLFTVEAWLGLDVLFEPDCVNIANEPSVFVKQSVRPDAVVDAPRPLRIIALPLAFSVFLLICHRRGPSIWPIVTAFPPMLIRAALALIANAKRPVLIFWEMLCRRFKFDMALIAASESFAISHAKNLQSASVIRKDWMHFEAVSA